MESPFEMLQDFGDDDEAAVPSGRAATADGFTFPCRLTGIAGGPDKDRAS